MSLRRDDSGSAYAWAVAVMGIFALTLLWLALTPAVMNLNDASRDSINSSLSPTSVEFQNAMDLYDLLPAIWRWLPLIYGLGLVAWAIIYSVVREAGQLL